GIIIQPGDFNPERIILDDGIMSTPLNVDVGDHFSGPAVGIMDYNFGNFKLYITQALARSPGGLAREVAAPPGFVNQITTGNFNVENLDPGDTSFATLAGLIVNNLRSPDLLSIEEIQDNNGETNDSVVDASVTWGML